MTEKRILAAAEKLWRSRGERGLTLRAVAREARTTTPTVYRRFRNKQALYLALGEKFRQDLTEVCLGAPTPEEFCRRYLRFAEDHPNEYRLLWNAWGDTVPSEDVPRPIRDWFLAQLANRFGGKAESYLPAFYGVMLLSHGASMLLTGPISEFYRQEIYKSFPSISDALLRNAPLFQL
ncbi:MAG TPA: TetR/AcrR family transcriptional regulator [Candidatus Acidoferrum sp.]|nr:TetR/AcrR family transcriptional regulator [Candidatus Acidoferrum sp.]